MSLYCNVLVPKEHCADGAGSLSGEEEEDDGSCSDYECTAADSVTPELPTLTWGTTRRRGSRGTNVRTSGPLHVSGHALDRSRTGTGRAGLLRSRQEQLQAEMLAGDSRPAKIMKPAGTSRAYAAAEASAAVGSLAVNHIHGASNPLRAESASSKVALDFRPEQLSTMPQWQQTASIARQRTSSAQQQQAQGEQQMLLLSFFCSACESQSHWQPAKCSSHCIVPCCPLLNASIIPAEVSMYVSKWALSSTKTAPKTA